MIRLSTAEAKRLKLPRGSAARKVIAEAEKSATGGFLAWRRLLDWTVGKLKAEDKVHIAIMNFLRTDLRADAIAFHPANESKRSAAWWALLYMLGTWRGMVDIIIFHQGRAYFIEVKTDSGELTIDQKEFLEWATASGFPCLVARSIGPVADFLTEHNLRATR